MPLHSALQQVTGSVAITSAITGSVEITEAVAISNFPAVQAVNDNGGSLTVDGTVDVGNFPAVQPVSDNGGSLTVDGTVTANQGTAAGLGAPWPVILVSGSDVIGTATHPIFITGSIAAVAAGVQEITGSVKLSEPVAISNFPAVQIVSGSNWIPTITGSVVVANQVNVTGSVGITAPVTVLQGTSPWIISGSSWIPTITGSVRVENIVQVTGSVVIGTRVDTRLLAMSATLIATPATASANVTLVGANPARAGLTIYNDAKKIVYVKFGVSASLTDYTMQMADDDYYEVPFGYTGRIDAFADVGAIGAIRVTEIV